MGDRELIGYIMSGLAAILAFAWRAVKVWARLRRDELAARREDAAAARNSDLAQASAMIELRNEVRAFIAFQRAPVFRPRRDDGDSDT